VDTVSSSRVHAFLEAINSVHSLALQEPKVLTYQQSMLGLLNESSDEALLRSRPNAHFTVSAFIFQDLGIVWHFFTANCKDGYSQVAM